MQNYKVNVEGMGFEYGTVCVPCVFAFMDEMKKQEGIEDVSFVITEKLFYVTSECGHKKTEKRTAEALEKAGLRLGKDFRMVSLTVSC
ncbi:hypothetical protein [Seleniivibrio sp.]|uniref:hypothetical protein n=1 Tax=Seleniivibrio sp. TaxID=2898801 RepID=UPI0025D43B88|nr:hypothetical protein [Seleniivibrio sp.]MCD8554845.1 hypothetical protein [Seleniivibrio sp.]